MGEKRGDVDGRRRTTDLSGQVAFATAEVTRNRMILELEEAEKNARLARKDAREQGLMQSDFIPRGRSLQRFMDRRIDTEATIGIRVAKVNAEDLTVYNPFRDRIPFPQLPPRPAPSALPARIETDKENESFLSSVHSVLYNGVEYLNGFELVRSLRRWLLAEKDLEEVVSTSPNLFALH